MDENVTGVGAELSGGLPRFGCTGMSFTFGFDGVMFMYLSIDWVLVYFYWLFACFRQNEPFWVIGLQLIGRLSL